MVTLQDGRGNNEEDYCEMANTNCMQTKLYEHVYVILGNTVPHYLLQFCGER